MDNSVRWQAELKRAYFIDRFKIRRHWQTALVAVCTAILCGCGTPAAGSSTPVPSTTLDASTESGLRLSLTLSPNPPTARKELSVKLVVTGGSSAGFHPKNVWISESMPGMSMPKQSVTLKSSGNGQFAGQILLVMGGKWEILVHLVDGSKQETQAFYTQVNE